MFRRKEDTLDPDPSFPADLKSLGYFINNLGHVRRIKAPDQEYVFRATNNDRVNNVYREAVQECMRQETEKRYEALGLQRLYFPGLTTEKPAGPHMPILAPAPEILKTRKRVIVLVNNLSQDLGILSYGQLQRELGLNGGSAVNFVKETIKRSAAGNAEAKYADIFKDGFKTEDTADVPGVVIANTGQLLYSHKYNTTMTLRSWDDRPRKSAMHAAVRIHDMENYVPGHRSPREHVKSVFDEVLCNTDRVAAGAEIYVIAIESGAEDVLDLLKEDFTKYGSRITAMALIHSLMDDSQIKDPVLRAFLRQRTREWKISDLTTDPTSCVELPPDFHDNEPSALTLEEPYVTTTRVSWSEDIANMPSVPAKEVTSASTLQPGKQDATEDIDGQDGWAISQAVICPTFAGGDSLSGENVFTNRAVQQAILKFFEGFARNPAYGHNSSIKLFNEAPKPTPENPLAFDPTTDPATLTSLPPAMSPEQAELDIARQALEHMKIAHEACTPTVEELQEGRNDLFKRIANQAARIDKLEREALAHGGLKSNESLDKRENWKPAPEGEQVSFAGTMVDSELLKAAGLGETAEDKLRKLHEKSAK